VIILIGLPLVASFFAFPLPLGKQTTIYLCIFLALPPIVQVSYSPLEMLYRIAHLTTGRYVIFSFSPPIGKSAKC